MVPDCSRFRRALPYAAAEGGHADHGVVSGIELDALDIREWQVVEGAPGFAVVAREPKARPGRTFSQGHVNPALVLRVEITAERLRPFAPNALPVLAAVLGKVEAAGSVAPACIRRAQQDSAAVAGIDAEILGIEQRFGGIDLLPGLRFVFGTIEADPLGHERFAGGAPPGADDGEK